MKTTLFIFLQGALLLLLFMSAHANITHDSSWAVKKCLECHPRAYPTHKAMVPGNMQAKLPLDKHGRMLCISCHKCIAGTCTIPKDRDDLCRACHDCTQGMACLLQTSHIGDSSDIGYLATRWCLECHGRTLNVKVCKLGSKTMDISFSQSDISSLKTVPDSRVVLINGKVTCVSCHDPYASQGARLFKSNVELDMCMACHYKLEKVDHSLYVKDENSCIGCHPRVWPTHKRAKPDPSHVALPLDAQGGMLCITCHDCTNGTCRLRLQKPELCTSCHDCTQGMACALSTAHLGGNQATNIRGKACQECHDNTSAKSCGLSDLAGFQSENVRCITCHDPYASRHTKLLSGVSKSVAVQQFTCPRNIVSDIPDCLECHKERR